MKKTGLLLKEKRESANLSISEVALATKINPKILTAIENGDSANLPAKTFLKGFLKSYALYLKMDVEEVLRTYQDETGGPPPERVHEAYQTPSAGSPASPPPRRRVGDENSSGMRTAAVVVIVILIGLIIGVRELMEKYQREKVVESAQNLKLSPLAQPAVTEVPQVQLANANATLTTSAPSPALGADPKAVEQKLAEANEKAAAEAKAAADKKVAEDKKAAEEKKAADDKKLAEEKKLADEKKAAEDKRAASEAKIADEKKAAEEKKAEEKRLAEEKKTADKKAADEKKAAAAEAKKAAAEAKAAEAKKAADEKKNAAEEKKAADEKTPDNVTAEDKKPAVKHSEIILEALDAVEVKFQVKGETKRVSLAPSEVHTIHADNPVVFDFSDGGAVNIILNGHERGVPGDLGKPKQVTIP